MSNDAIRVACPKCGRVLVFGVNSAGMIALCRRCESDVPIPPLDLSAAVTAQSKTAAPASMSKWTLLWILIMIALGFVAVVNGRTPVWSWGFWGFMVLIGGIVWLDILLIRFLWCGDTFLNRLVEWVASRNVPYPPGKWDVWG